MALLPLVAPSGSTAEMRLAQLSPTDPTFENASLLFYAAGIAQMSVAMREDETISAKESVLITTAEINKNNALSENLRLRREIVESNWPIEPAAQAELIGLLQDDAAFPPPGPVAAGSFYVETLDWLNESKARAQEILDKLITAQTNADSGIGAVAPLPAQPTAGGYALDQAVTDWLKAQGLQVSGTDWTTAVFLDGGVYRTVSSDVLTQPEWSFPVPGVLRSPYSDDIYIALDDGSIQRGERLPIELNQTAAELKAKGYDLSLYPSLPDFPGGTWGFPPLPLPSGTATQLLGVLPVQIGDRIYAVATDELTVDPGLAWAATGDQVNSNAAAIGGLNDDLFPAKLPFNTSGAGGSFYWSDGAVIYKGVSSEFTQMDFSAPAGTVGLLNTGPRLAAYLAKQGVLEPVDRLMSEVDESAVALQLEGRTKSITSIINQWANTADAENLRLKTTYNDYAVAMNMLTNIIEKMAQCLNSLVPK